MIAPLLFLTPRSGKKTVMARTPEPVLPGDEFWTITKNLATSCVDKALVRSKEAGGGFFAALFSGKKASKPEGTESTLPALQLSYDTLARYSIIHPDDVDAKQVREKLRTKPQQPFLEDPRLDRAIGSFVSMAIGDALGAPLEFRAVRYKDDEPILTGFDPEARSGFGMYMGQWTDDASMGACLADSLLWCEGFDPFDTMTRFASWWHLGYNNATRLATKTGHSVGLGGNISMSLDEFMRTGKVFTTAGDKNTSGNGSLMRNAAVPVRYWNDLPQALEVARKQSLLTHQGEEAAECCAALTHFVVNAISNPTATKQQLFEKWQAEFVTENNSVKHLVRSEAEPSGDPNRDWRWKAERFYYSESRASLMPGYVGSYAMDALSMALHCVWKTTSYESAMLMAANRCGDADSVCDITGQIAGAVYGHGAIPLSWLEALRRWDGDEFTIKGFKLFHHRPARVLSSVP
jgi:ADP-ribosyl-[dinitrogen reductase] hydrolase